jgi:DNA-binding CsgD family transcriptional regulator
MSRIALRRILVLHHGHTVATGVQWAATGRYALQVTQPPYPVLMCSEAEEVEQAYPGCRLVTAWDELTGDPETDLQAVALERLEDYPEFSRRQWEILKAVHRGQDNSQIAAGIGMSLQTVKQALSELFTLTGAPNRVLLAVWYERLRLGME